MLPQSDKNKRYKYSIWFTDLKVTKYFERRRGGKEEERRGGGGGVGMVGGTKEKRRWEGELGEG